MNKEKKKSESNKKVQGNILKILARLAGYMLQYKKLFSLVLIGLIVSSVLSLVNAWIIRLALDNYFVPSKVKYLWVIAIAIVFAAMIQGIIDYLNRYFAERKGQTIVYKIRQQVYTHLMKLSFSYFDNTNTGDLMSRITADAETLQGFFGFASLQIISNAFFIFGVLITMFIWNVNLALLYIAMMPFMLLGITRYAFKVRPAFGKIRRSLANLNSTLQEQILGIQVIKIFGREKHVAAKFDRMNTKNLNVTLEAGRITSFWMPYVFVFVGIGTGIILWFGGRKVILAEISLGTLVGFITFIGMMMRPIRQTGMLIAWIMNGAAAAERIFNVLDTKPQVEENPNAILLENVIGKVNYDNVSFTYDGEKSILQNISFEANPGETIAIVGPTGAGKTTLMHLLPRFYDSIEGTISIDGRNIKDFTIDSLRKNIGIVMQHTFLFNMTVRENIAFGKQDVSFEEVVEAAKNAQIHDFIMSLPEQYDAMLQERGSNLSGGQRQRISIARTLIMDPQILILDEPTASIDAKTDEAIQKALAILCKNRTVFIIAHRLWTLKNSNKILVISDGHVEQFDTHDNLINREGLYRDIYTLQINSEKFGIENPNKKMNKEDE